MYGLKITNNYIEIIDAGPSHVRVNETFEFPDISGAFFYIKVPHVGTIYIRDLGEEKIPGYDFLKGAHGVLVRMRTTEAYYRFDGKGDLELIVDHLGICTLSTNNGKVIEIRLPELIVQ